METLTEEKLTLLERVNDLTQMIQQGQVLEAFEKYYAEEVTMQENETEPIVGKDACRAKEEAFVNNIVAFRKADVESIVVGDNLTVVQWGFDFTHAEWGERNYNQIAVQRWNEEGQIVNEKFYYNK